MLPKIFSKSFLKQFIKFGIVGASGIVVNLAILFLFTETFKFYYVFSEVIAFLVSGVNNYILDKIWTFQEVLKEKIVRKYSKFVIISIITLIVNLSLLFFLVEILNIWYILAELEAIIFVFSLNFIGNKFWTFRKYNSKDEANIEGMHKTQDIYKVLVFLPTYNEQANISRIIDAINKLDFNKKILIVDDKSTDGTLEIIKKKRKEYDNITLIIRKGPKGRGLAGIIALKYFIKSDNDLLVELDADFSHNPKYIPKLLQYFPLFDVVIGSRLIGNGGGEQGRPILRHTITLFANLLIQFLFKTKIRDCTSGFRVFKKDLIMKFNLINFFSVHYSITPEILYACILNKAKIKEIPIVFYERAGGKSKLNFKKIFYTFLGIIRIVLRGNKIIKIQNRSN